MPRYYCVSTLTFYRYCWADNEEQAKHCMNSYFGLLGYGNCVRLGKSVNQNKDATSEHEPNFCADKQPLPKEVTDGNDRNSVQGTGKVDRCT